MALGAEVRYVENEILHQLALDAEAPLIRVSGAEIFLNTRRNNRRNTRKRVSEIWTVRSPERA